MTPTDGAKILGDRNTDHRVAFRQREAMLVVAKLRIGKTQLSARFDGHLRSYAITQPGRK